MAQEAAREEAVRYEYRADGWPLCPNCGEDEMYSLHFSETRRNIPPTLGEYLSRPLRCYACAFEADVPMPRILPGGGYARGA